jgi:hypothetical protein
MKQLSEPLSTGEMIPGAASSPAAPAQSRPVDLTKDIQRPTFDTATTNRLQAAPGAYEEAMKRLVPQKQMTATFNGQQFTAQPQARMDRNELERLIARKQLDEQKSIADADIQKGRDAQMAMARIPGENASALQKVKNEGELANTGLLNERAEKQAGLQYANNDVERQVAQTKIDLAKQQLEQSGKTFDAQQRSAVSPQQARIDELIKTIQPENLATEQQRQAYKLLLSMGSQGSALGETGVDAVSQLQNSTPWSGKMQAIVNDPGLVSLAEKLKASAPAFLSGADSRRRNENDKALLFKYADSLAAQHGLPEAEVRQMALGLL